MNGWSLAPIFDNLLVVLATIAALLLLLLVGPNFGRLARSRKALLAALRVAAILLLAAAMLRPTHIRTQRQPQPAVVLLLADRSRSMTQPNGAGSRSRWEAQRDALAAVDAIRSSLSPQLELKLYTYDAQLRPMESTTGGWTLNGEPTGEVTDLGTALADAVEAELGKRIAGVVLLGDGVQTAPAPRVEVQQAGRDLARLGHPLFTVGFGPAADQAQARDVIVESLRDQYSVFVKNEVEIRGQLRIRGYANQETSVELLVRKIDEQTGGPLGQDEPIGRRTVLGPADDRQVEVAFPYTPQEPGRYKLTLRAAVQPGELVTKNNELSSFLTVLEGGVKLLYLEGELRHEQRFLARALDGAPDVDLEVQWIDRRRRDRWPVDLRSALEDPKYDAFLVGDLDSAAFGPQNLARLAKAVENGKGLAMLGGAHSFGPGGYFGTPVGDALPIVMDRFERQNFGDKPRPDLQLPGPLGLRPVKSHPITRLAPADANEALWRSFPPLLGANKFVGVKDDPGVEILVESTAGAPLLVAGEYGQGRVAAFAGDSTWTWAMHGRQAEHRRFWRQLALWLARRDDVVRSDVWIELGQRRYPPGSRVVFTAGAKSAAGEPIPGVKLEAKLIRPGGRAEPLTLAVDGSRFSGAIAAAVEPGDYRIELEAQADGRSIGKTHSEFMVFDQDVELVDPAADYEQLARLAGLTRAVGGRTLAPEQLPDLVRELDARREEQQVEIQTRWQLGGSAGAAWALLLALAGLLTAEWYLRKKWGLV